MHPENLKDKGTAATKGHLVKATFRRRQKLQDKIILGNEWQKFLKVKVVNSVKCHTKMNKMTFERVAVLEIKK